VILRSPQKQARDLARLEAPAVKMQREHRRDGEQREEPEGIGEHVARAS
jgi:hypothetical protein